MKLNKIIIKKAITNFIDGTEIVLDINKINLIYGHNAIGKTSISRIFKLLSKNTDEKEKIEIRKNIKNISSNEDSSVEYFDFQDKPVCENDLNIYVFNKDYIYNKIESTTEFHNNSFEVVENIDNNIVNPLEKDYKNAKYKFDSLKQELDTEKKEYIKSMADVFEVLKKNVNLRRKLEDNNFFIYNEIQNILKKDEKIVLVESEEILKKYNAYKNVDNSKQIKDYNADILGYTGFVEELKDLLKFSESIIESKYIIELMSMKDEEKKTWIKNGFKYIINDDCPFCGSKENSTIINEYKNYKISASSKKDEQLQILSSKVIKCEENIRNQNKTLKLKLEVVKEFIPNLEELEKNIDMKTNSSYNIKEKISSLILLKKDEIKIDILNKYDESIDKDIKDLENIDKFIRGAIQDLNEKIEKSNTIKNTISEEYLQKYMEPYLALKFKEKFDAINTLNKSLELADKEYNEKHEILKQDLESKKPLIKVMNKNLLSMNIIKYKVNENFQLELDKVNVNEKFTNYLSDGEKTSIAMALFLSEIECSVNSDKIDIIVFDDPISSLDYENIYNVYYIIKKMWTDKKNDTQFVILTHNNIFYNFFKYMGDSCKFNKLIKENLKTTMVDDKQYKSLYMEKLKIINDIKNNDGQPTQEQKLYIPNFCRYVFETQSMFLFPNCSEPMKELTKLIEKLCKQGEIVINKVRLGTYLDVCNSGSHANQVEVFDREDISLNIKELCADTIKITKKLFEGQIDNI